MNEGTLCAMHQALTIPVVLYGASGLQYCIVKSHRENWNRIDIVKTRIVTVETGMLSLSWNGIAIASL
ncbi:hypothetical protein E2C01_074100 [Portunus trituberculatus]|uniref:Uncharacterized protein n=1 Tax=Portunus trituberculatus TaxID=210409 RepID=A0A5B7IFF5_PORTR|nr:hypothetical protein [Portunus trituberculatus]